jgi:cytoskeletal protein CcmA (bactofilin family)
VSDIQGTAFISRETVFRGRIKGARIIVIDGYVEGNVSAGRIVVQQGGQLFGQVVAGELEVHGTVQGDIRSRGLVSIGATGVVSGDVQYGAIQLAPGGDLSASMRNIPPRLTGDFEMTVNRGRYSILTPDDLQAVDPDNTAEGLTFSVVESRAGHIALRSQPVQPVERFSQADLDEGKIVFQHDGTAGGQAQFKVSVMDASGASAAEPATVTVAVGDYGRTGVGASA